MRRVYRTKNSLKLFYFIFLALSLFLGAKAYSELPAAGNAWLRFPISIVLVLVGLGSATQSFTACVVLSEESIYYGSIFRRHSLRLDQIRYRREYEEYRDTPEGGVNVSYLEFIPSSVENKSLKIAKDDFDLDNVFWEWVLRIPDLQDSKHSPLRGN